MNITIAELLDALSTAQQQTDELPPNTYSGPEIRRAMGIGAEKLAALVRSMVANGTMQVIHVKRKAIDGRMCRVAAYQIIVPTKRKK